MKTGHSAPNDNMLQFSSRLVLSICGLSAAKSVVHCSGLLGYEHRAS